MQTLTIGIVATADIEVTRGPLGRFVDLAAEIEAAGGVVPPRILAAIREEEAPIPVEEP